MNLPISVTLGTITHIVSYTKLIANTSYPEDKRHQLEKNVALKIVDDYKASGIIM